MVEKLTREKIAEHAIVHVAPPACIRNAPVDRTFELPPALYAAMVGLFLGFLAVTGLGFAHPEMIIPMAIFTLFIVAGFGLPTIWTRMEPANPARPMCPARFRRDGIQTATGRNTATQATVQVLILPALLLVWGLAAVTIAALVG